MHDIRTQLHQEIPLRGCVYGLLFSVPIWLLVGLFVWWITKS